MKGAAPLLPLKSRGRGSKITLLMLPTDIIFARFLLAFVLPTGATSLCPQEFITCHQMHQWLEVYVCERQTVIKDSDVIMTSQSVQVSFSKLLSPRPTVALVSLDYSDTKF